TKRIKRSGTAAYTDAEAMVFRSVKTGRMLLRIIELPEPKKGEYYEVWAAQGSKPDHLIGLIKPPLRYDLLYPLDSMTNASALVIKSTEKGDDKSQLVCRAVLSD